MPKAAAQAKFDAVKGLHCVEPFEFGQSEGEALPSKFSGTAYGGGAAHGGMVVIDLATLKVAGKKMPLLCGHDRREGEVIGVVETSEISASAFTVGGKLFSDMDDEDGCAAKKIAKRAKRGAPYQMSIGVFGFREEFVPLGNSVAANGRTFNGPVYVLRDGTVREVSIVTLGADWAADAQLFAQPDPAKPGTKKEATMPTIEELQAQLAEANAANAKLLKETSERAAAERGVAMDALFAECGTKPTDAERGEFASMTPAQFGAVGTQLRAVAAKLKKLDPKLFAEQAKDDGAGEKAASNKGATFSSTDVYAKRVQQARAVAV